MLIMFHDMAGYFKYMDETRERLMYSFCIVKLKTISHYVLSSSCYKTKMSIGK